MNEQHTHSKTAGPKTAAWGAVVSMMLGVFALATAEFLPPSVLTPIASDLGITVALAGQTVTATAALAFASSLLTPFITRRINRRNVLLGFSALLIASNLMVALAPNFAVLLSGRVVLGIAMGGFWAMSISIVMRLVPESQVARALALVMSGLGAATIVAAPIGSYFGAIIGWRGVFWLAAALGLLALVTQLLTLPRMAPKGQTRLRTLVDVMKRPRMRPGLFAVMLIFGGNYALFTYVRPYLQDITGVAVTGVSAILLAFGVANYVGSHLGGWMLQGNTKLTMTLVPLLMGVIGIVLGSGIGTPITTTVLVAIWGLVFGTVPVAWSTWITHTVPDEAESGGGLLVATIQVAIAAGAGIGGIVLNAGVVTSVFVLGGLVLVAAWLFITFAVKPGERPQQADEIIRQEETAMIAGEIGSAVDDTMVNRVREELHISNNTGAVHHDH